MEFICSQKNVNVTSTSQHLRVQVSDDKHANAFAILTGVSAGSGRAQGSTLQSIDIARHLENDSTLAPASIYFLFYVHEALRKAGLGDDYLSQLSIWKEYLKLGMTTWGEVSNVRSTRSDCHAWGASSNIELFHTVLGISSAAPAFKKVVIAPHLGTLKQIGGTMPTPYGDITVEYQLKGTKLDATITLPEGITGTFQWNGKEQQPGSGKNVVTE